MSKTTLRRALASMSAGQLIELISDLYAARPEAKEYLEFFINPDIEKRLAKAQVNIKKELNRSARGRNRARITRVKRYVRDISSLDPGAEYVLDIRLYALEQAMIVGANEWIKDVTQKGVARFLEETIVYANGEGMLDSTISRISKAIENMSPRSYYPRQFKELLTNTLQSSIENLAH